ncbi:Asp23/Gls24 family envelope stress response protein [Salinithrix halophila]|uniref:Asp23/Gls24 family envelope stress response protein n=1 Tax=Salinithrix halophila TaxID=1485204 RepID=A0ABV8JMA2_9BACL
MAGETRQHESMIATEVLETIAAVAAMETKGVTGMSGGLVDGVTRRFSRGDHPMGVEVRSDEGKVTLHLRVTVAYGENIPEVGNRAIYRVSEAIRDMTGIRPDDIRLRVEGVTLPEEQEESTENEE